MAHESFTALAAIVLFGVWMLVESRAKGRTRIPLHGGRPVVSIELDEEERAELKSVLSSYISGPRMGIADSGSRDPGDGLKKPAVVEKVLRLLE